MIRILLLFLFIITSLFSQEALNLSRAIEIALENNYQIKLAKKQNNIAENNNTIGNAGFLPSLDLGVDYSESSQQSSFEFANDPGQVVETVATNERLGANLNLNWTLFDGFAMISNLARLDLLEENSKIQYQLAIENNLRDVISTYISLINAKQNLNNLINSINLSRKRLSLTKSKFEYGSVSGGSILQAEVDFNNDSSAILKSEIDIANLERSLNYLMGLKQIKKFEYETQIQFSQIDSLYVLEEKLFRSNNSINLALNEERISQKDKELIVSQFYPRVDLRAAYEYSRTESVPGFFTFNESYGPSINLSAQMNIFDGFRKYQNLDNAEIQIEMANIQIEDIRSSIRFNLINLYQTYLQQDKLIELSRSNIETAEQNLERQINSYELGNITSLQFREAQINLLQTEIALNNALASKKQTESFLLLLIGEIPN